MNKGYRRFGASSSADVAVTGLYAVRTYNRAGLWLVGNKCQEPARGMGASPLISLNIEARRRSVAPVGSLRLANYMIARLSPIRDHEPRRRASSTITIAKVCRTSSVPQPSIVAIAGTGATKTPVTLTYLRLIFCLFVDDRVRIGIKCSRANRG